MEVIATTLEDRLKKAYLELVKKVITHSLWPVEFKLLSKRNSTKINDKIRNLIIEILKTFNFGLVRCNKKGQIDMDEGLGWPSHAETMIGFKRLENLEYCCVEAIINNIEGDFLEAGVWRGGATIFMKAILKAYGDSNRKIWVADSFEGLPKPNLEKYPADRGDMHFKWDELKVSLEEVRSNFLKYDLLDENIIFLKGWFKDTLPNAKIEKLAVIRLDGDMYESTWDSLVNLYPKLQLGGHIIIDDYYNNKSCRQAVTDYREKTNISAKIIQIDWTGAFWQKK